MNTSKQKLNSHAAESPGLHSTSLLANYPADSKFRTWVLVAVLLALCGGAVALFAEDSSKQKPPTKRQYDVTLLGSLGGTNSRGDSINDRGWVSGYSNLAGNPARHATLWQGLTPLDLGTLGGPNSTVAWPVKNDRGLIVGIAQTATPDPLGEAWSSAGFYTGPNRTGYITLGFVWQDGQMRGLPTLGGNNGYATGANNRGIVTGWAENNCHDATCVPPQVLQFRPVVWDTRRNDQVSELPLFPGDTSGAATAINDENQVVGISGICDQAVGRHTAKHAVLWDKGNIIDLGNLGAPWWNTPTAINNRGDVVGFAGGPGDPDGNFLHGFIWTKA